MSKPVKQYHTDQVHYLRGAVDVAADGIGAKEIGILPSGCSVIGAKAQVTTIFDGDAPALTVGTNAGAYDNLLSAVAETAIGPGVNDSLALPIAGDTAVYARVAGSGAATTAGAADLFILYAPDNR